MKKIVFSALLAVTVGGVFASKTFVPAYAKIGTACKAATTIELDCTTTNEGPQCTALAIDSSGVGIAFRIQAHPFLCSDPLKQP